MKDRIVAAWRVLRGTHQAVPKGASWFYANTFTASTFTPTIYFNHTQKG